MERRGSTGLLLKNGRPFLTVREENLLKAGLHDSLM